MQYTRVIVTSSFDDLMHQRPGEKNYDFFLFKQRLWNAKLTETQIYRELSIEIESSLFN